MAINQDLKAATPRTALRSGFLSWLLHGSESESLSRLDEAGHGTKALRMDAWGAMRLPLPPLDEQDEITEFLDRKSAKTDALIAEQEKFIALLQERRSALITAAVTGQIDVRGAISQELTSA